MPYGKVCLRQGCLSDAELLLWPGNSPDLNPIENVWLDVKEQLRPRQKVPNISPFENTASQISAQDSGLMEEMRNCIQNKCFSFYHRLNTSPVTMLPHMLSLESRGGNFNIEKIACRYLLWVWSYFPSNLAMSRRPYLIGQ